MAEGNPSGMTPAEAHDRVTCQAPNEEGVKRHQALSDLFVRALLEVAAIVPAGREQSLAFTKLEEAKMWASKGVARNDRFNLRGKALLPGDVG